MNNETPSRYRMNFPCDPMDLMQLAGGDLFRSFCLGSAMKYVARAGLKEGESIVDDLGKAEHYLRRFAGTRGYTLGARYNAGDLPKDVEELRAQVIRQLLLAYHHGQSEYLVAYYMVQAWDQRERQRVQAEQMRKDQRR